MGFTSNEIIAFKNTTLYRKREAEYEVTDSDEGMTREDPKELSKPLKDLKTV
jgi:hypothetical protein